LPIRIRIPRCGSLRLKAIWTTATPQTVANFLGYVSAYPNTLFHRAPAGFVLQGGGYQVYDSQSDVFEHIPVGAPVANEPGISNTVGTLAMAKVGDNPNSATSEFFVNLGDNSANLDSQNGGFTVFGRVATPSLTGALAALEAFPIGNYNVNVYDPLTSSTTSSTFNDLPYDPSSASFATITSISALPVLTYSITTPPNSTVATATISGSSLQITAVASGSTSVVVGATDVDGNTTTQTVGLTVQNTLAQWAAAQGYTGALASGTADANHNGLTNLQEFAFLANPATATLAQQPQMALTPVASNTYAEITFPVRKFAAGLTYSVEASNTLASNDWTTLWTSNDGFTAPVVSKTVDQSDRTVVTIRDTQAASAVSRRFLRVKLIGP